MLTKGNTPSQRSTRMGESVELVKLIEMHTKIRSNYVVGFPGPRSLDRGLTRR
jgi:hypothetical protein